jgi:site-specific recombinase XerD
MGRAHTPAHANKALIFLRRVYNVALYQLEVYDGHNPAIKMPLYPSTPRERFLSSEELQRFMAALPHVPPKPGTYFLTLLLTGARRAEVQHIRWADVEWSTRLWKKPRTKNGSSQFTPLPVQVVEALKALPRTSQWVFPGDNGKPWSLGSIQKAWDKIRWPLNMHDVGIHDLRRTCASYLAIEGENLPIIQTVLNHKNLAHTATYARLNTKAVDRALQAQADRLCHLPGGTMTHGAPVVAPINPSSSMIEPIPEIPPRKLTLVAQAAPPSSAAMITGDLELDRIIWKTWARLPSTMQARYVAAAASLQIPLYQALSQAIEYGVKRLEQQFGLAPRGKPVYGAMPRRLRDLDDA